MCDDYHDVTALPHQTSVTHCCNFNYDSHLRTGPVFVFLWFWLVKKDLVGLLNMTWKV